MPATGEWTDVLRALGRFLDAQQPSSIEILNREAFLAVFWDVGAPGTEQRAYQEHHLEALRAEARLMRSGGASNPGGSLAELLRTLGQDLDVEKVDFSRIAFENDSFIVSGETGGKYFRRVYSTEELLEASAARRAARVPARAALAITAGASVATKDDQRAGKVKETKRGFLRISPSFLQRDYWLPLTCVASVEKEHVHLATTKAELEQIKSYTAPTEG